RTIFEKNADVERAPASLVKLMTLYLAFESIERGRVDVEDVVTVSPHASRVGRYRMGLRTGEHVPLRVLLEGVAIASANDAAAAPGGQALKTGFTHEAGYNLAVAAWRGGQEFVMIVLGSRSRAQSFLDAKRVLRFGFVETGLDPPEPERVRPTKKSIRVRRAAQATP